MKVSKAIAQLKVGDTVWVKGKVLEKDTTEQPLKVDNSFSTAWLYKDTEISLTEPKDEKVEVNEEQVRLLKKYENEPLFSLIGECREKEEELLARARLCGYTVKPKRWVVRTSSAYFEQFSGDSNHPFNFDATHNICVALTFNDSAKAEAVALLVDGSVEEI